MSDLITGRAPMILTVVRAIFITVVVYIALSYAEQIYQRWEPLKVLGIALVGSVAIIALDVAARRKSLLGLTGVFFGLMVGLICTYAICIPLDLVAETFYRGIRPETLTIIKLLIGATVCYACVSVVLQSKDDIRLVIPYVEFSKQVKGPRPLLLDTSVIIDGRIVDVADSNILDSPLMVPRFVLQELQEVADSRDRLKRNRGRRGLDVLRELQSNPKVEVIIYDGEVPAVAANEGVDQKLVALAATMEGSVMTNDFNLNKVAQVRGVKVVNLNDLANALKPALMAGEKLCVRITREGQEPGQGVGYLDDGTMVVVEGARQRVGESVDLVVNNVLQTAAGKMIFGRLAGMPPAARRTRTGDEENCRTG
jgi:uncharacterized protein YacL